MHRLQDLAKSLNTILIKLRTDDKFKAGFMKLLDMAKSPIIRMTFGDSVDIGMIESVMTRLMNDQTIFDIIETVHNILQCFSVDRFITVNNENDIQNIAHDLQKKNLFLAALYFNETNNKNIIYKIKVEPDNTPITLESKNRFWFPGPDASMELDLKYHRGFVQMKHSIDMGIIKYKKKLKNDFEIELKKNQSDNAGNKTDSWWMDWDDENTQDDDDDSILTVTPILNRYKTTTPIIPTVTGEISSDDNNATEIDSINTTEQTAETIDLSEGNKTNGEVLHRKKRQLEDLLGMLFGGGNKKSPEEKINVEDVQVYTKQFPYPSYVKDE